MGHVGLNTRSQGQIFRKPCFHSRGLICDPILMKRGQNVYLDNISDNVEYEL